jgi:uridine kinase
MKRGSRSDLLRDLVEAIGSIDVEHPVRVAVDGPPAGGKTTLADELADVLSAQGRQVIRATIDEFMFLRAERYVRGLYSAESCYFDSHDYESLIRVLLEPLGPGGDRVFQTAVYDHDADIRLPRSTATAATDALLLFDGVFLLRPELLDRWELRILVMADFDVTLNRARTRDFTAYGSAAAVERRFRERYLPAQRLYFEHAHPVDHADIIMHNDEPQRPTWEFRTP